MTTMTVDPPSKRSLGVGFDSNRNRAGNPQAWKQQIGTKQIPARLALLPEAKPTPDSGALPGTDEDRHSIFLYRYRATGDGNSRSASAASATASTQTESGRSKN